jgi:hypothetical protein
MSDADARVRAALEQVEAWLADPAWEPDPSALAKWNKAFQAALLEAEKGPGWPDLATRAHRAGQAMEARLEVVVKARDRIRADLEAHERGGRALRGYGASTR